MKRVGWLISRYLLSTILPYFAFAWLLLSAILFVQQAGKFSDIFFNLTIPGEYVWQLALALIPNVIAFTCPMAILVATIIGIAKLRTDSELVAIRAAGVSNLQLAVPIILLGVLLSAFAFLVNLKGVPVAAGLVRNVALQAAIKKLESPVEPGVFNTEVTGYTIYVHEGDKETGIWKNLFIFKEDPKTAAVTLITSETGRMDLTDQTTELVLSNARVVTLPTKGTVELVSENIEELRIAIQTRRGELLDKLTNGNAMPEELGLSELSTYANTLEGKQRTEAEILWQRRITLSIAPFLFCLLGFAISLRFNRGGRGFGSLIALAVLIGYYLIAFGSEQLARTGAMSVAMSGSIPILAALALTSWFGLTSRFSVLSFDLFGMSSKLKSPVQERNKARPKTVFVNFTTGLRDTDMVINLAKFFALAVVFLASVFLIFTAFELWKFAGVIDGGTVLLLKYLGFLLPYIYLQLAPTAVLIAILATFVTKSRNHEFVTWAAAGQSAYRLLIPCFLFALFIGISSFGIQELIAPNSNRVQDALRLQIRRGGTEVGAGSRTWVASGNRIYSFVSPGTSAYKVRFASDNEVTLGFNDWKGHFDLDERSYASDNVKNDGNYWSARAGEIERSFNVSDNGIGNGRLSLGLIVSDLRLGVILSSMLQSKLSASDNEMRFAECDRCVRDIVIYEFDKSGRGLQTVYRSKLARWNRDRVSFVSELERTSISGIGSKTELLGSGELIDQVDPFAEAVGRPSHLSLGQLKKRLSETDSDSERALVRVALEKRYTTIVSALIIALFAAPLALSLTGKRNVIHIAYAVGCWLVFIGFGSIFAQFGESGQLAAVASIWFPIVIFGLLGIYLLSKMRT